MMMFTTVHFLFSENINIYLQDIGNPFLDFLFLAISAIFSEPGLLLLSSIIFWCFDKGIGIRLMYLTLLSAFVAIFAKSIFGMPRPPEYLHKTPANGFGFPSGHVLPTSGFWGYLVVRLKNPPVIIMAATSIIAISLSRVYLGVHYVGDVAGGILFGLSIVLITLRTEPGILKLLKGLERKSKYFVAVMLPLIPLTISTIQWGLLSEQVEIGIVMAGIGVGYLLEEDHMRFENAKNNKQRIRRFLAGMLTLSVIYFSSNLMFSDLIILKYGALGLSSTFIAPWVFAIMETNLKN